MGRTLLLMVVVLLFRGISSGDSRSPVNDDCAETCKSTGGKHKTACTFDCLNAGDAHEDIKRCPTLIFTCLCRTMSNGDMVASGKNEPFI